LSSGSRSLQKLLLLRRELSSVSTPDSFSSPSFLSCSIVSFGDPAGRWRPVRRCRSGLLGLELLEASFLLVLALAALLSLTDTVGGATDHRGSKQRSSSNEHVFSPYSLVEPLPGPDEQCADGHSLGRGCRASPAAALPGTDENWFGAVLGPSVWL
jgi:hypothetical protein